MPKTKKKPISKATATNSIFLHDEIEDLVNWVPISLEVKSSQLLNGLQLLEELFGLDKDHDSHVANQDGSSLFNYFGNLGLVQKLCKKMKEGKTASHATKQDGHGGIR